MKNIKYIMGFFVFIPLLFCSCEEDKELGEIITPSNLEVNVVLKGQDDANPNGDGSGEVTLTASADNALSYSFVYQNTTSVAPDGTKAFTFGEIGINTYSIAVVAYGTSGMSTSKLVEVEVFADYQPPADLVALLTSGAWRVKEEEANHFGLSPSTEQACTWYCAPVDDKAGTAMAQNRFVFNLGTSGINGTLDNVTNFGLEAGQGAIPGKGTVLNNAFGSDRGQVANEFDDVDSYPVDQSAGLYNEDVITSNWSISAPGGVETINISGLGFLGYYLDVTAYEIQSRSATEIKLRGIGYDTNAWYFTLVNSERGDGGVVPEPELDVVYENLIWSDEFESDGAPDPASWNYDIGRGDNGWGNSELQYYTDRSDNVIVSDGTLKITARKEAFSGASYTSTRMKTQGLREFTYGRIEVRAKLPEGGGTWPAIWMLGANFGTVGWPATGEIDIMEHVGNNPNTVSAAIHTPSSFGNTVNKGETIASNVSSEFHNYAVNWSADQISFLVDDVIFYTYKPSGKSDTNWPFDNDQFIILNIAMGGTLGGTIDPAFNAATMEVDYVRVYK